MKPARLILTLCILALALGACGKRGGLRAPEGKESAYTFPKVYPKPSSVLPDGTAQTRPRTREVPRGAGDLSTFPNSRTTTTYGDPEAQ